MFIDIKWCQEKTNIWMSTLQTAHQTKRTDDINGEKNSFDQVSSRVLLKGWGKKCVKTGWGKNVRPQTVLFV